LSARSYAAAAKDDQRACAAWAKALKSRRLSVQSWPDGPRNSSDRSTA
jgi:hypothetical protein